MTTVSLLDNILGFLTLALAVLLFCGVVWPGVQARQTLMDKLLIASFAILLFVVSTRLILR